VGSADWLVTSVFGLVAVVQLLSHVQLFATSWTAAPGFFSHAACIIGTIHTRILQDPIVTFYPPGLIIFK